MENLTVRKKQVMCVWSFKNALTHSSQIVLRKQISGSFSSPPLKFPRFSKRKEKRIIVFWLVDKELFRPVLRSDDKREIFVGLRQKESSSYTGVSTWGIPNRNFFLPSSDYLGRINLHKWWGCEGNTGMPYS